MKLATHLQQSNLLYLTNGCENLSVAENDHYRWLLFDNVVQSIMLKRAPAKLIIAHQYFLVLPLLFSTPKKIVELGLGGGNLVRFLDNRLPESTIISIENNQQVIDCYYQFFNPQEIQQPIINCNFDLWLTKKKNQQYDWLIYDIYQTDDDPQNFLKHIRSIVNKMSDNAWLSINLPDLNEHELNIALLYLASIKNDRVMRYFQIPHYKNIVIHLGPQDKPLSSECSQLPHYMFTRWSKLWVHGLVVR
ncbi:spermidine synthase [Colwelliaceae bacterium 6441]